MIHRTCGRASDASLSTRSVVHFALWIPHVLTLKAFYAGFETSNIGTPSQLTPKPHEHSVTNTTASEVRRTLQVNPQKAPDPHEIPGRVLKDCAHQLSEVLTEICNNSLSHTKVPSCLKISTITPVTKRSAASSYSPYPWHHEVLHETDDEAHEEDHRLG